MIAWVKRTAKKITYYGTIRKRFGWEAVRFLLESKRKRNRLDCRTIKGAKHPLFLSNFYADVTTLFQVFLAGEYNISLREESRVIIDCGANVGFSAVFFANKYPKAKIFALEPDENNFRFMQKNTAPYQTITCLNKAVWSKAANLKLVDRGTGNWSLQTRAAKEGESNTVEGIGLKDLMEQYGLETIDLLKIDIEGAEKELFHSGFEDWLSKTKALAIELHAQEYPGITAVFQKALKDRASKQYWSGENWVCEFTNT